MKKIKTANVPWVFWISISVRKKWFSYCWSARGANFKEFQCCVFKISIGMPWVSTYLTYPDYYDENTKDTNDGNLSRKFSFLIERHA